MQMFGSVVSTLKHKIFFLSEIDKYFLNDIFREVYCLFLFFADWIDKKCSILYRKTNLKIFFNLLINVNHFFSKIFCLSTKSTKTTNPAIMSKIYTKSSYCTQFTHYANSITLVKKY